MFARGKFPFTDLSAAEMNIYPIVDDASLAAYAAELAYFRCLRA
jgi:hypothetical protein